MDSLEAKEEGACGRDIPSGVNAVGRLKAVARLGNLAA